MPEEAIFSIVIISIFAGSFIITMAIRAVRLMVCAKLANTLKLRCVAAGMSADEIERVVLVGSGTTPVAKQQSRDKESDYFAPVEKAPPVLAGRY
jgi:hypothetical protein